MNVELVFGQIALLLSAAAAAGAIALVLRQPPLLAYLAVGVAAGPTWLRLTTAEEAIELLAMLGIAVLLFIVGLKLDLHVVKMMGPIALLLGAGQVTLTFLAGYPIAWALGLDPTDALYVAVALTFSSTIIVVKLLSDQRQIDALHGRLALGILIVQDIVVIAILVVLSAFGQTTGNQSLPWHALLLVVKIILLITGAGLAAKYLMPRLAPLLARSSEVLVLSALGWALALATAASALGLSKEVGAFLAGFSLASTAFRDAIGGRLVSLRDFLLLFFFLNLGAELDFSHISVQIGPAIALVLFVLLGKPLIIMVLLGALGYRARTSLMTALTGSQISEFSLIFVALGTELGHVTSETLGLITLVGMITIAVSTYTILLADPLHERLTPYLRLFERKVPKRETAGELPLPPKSDVLIFGLGRYGGAIAHRLREHGLQILGIDFDPEVVTQWRQAGLPAHYGDADDPEVISGLPLSHIPLVICAIPTFDTNLALLRTLRLSGYTGTLALTAHTQSDADRLKKAGADLVLCPFADAAERAADILLETVTGQQPSEQRRTVIAAPGSASVSGEKPGELLASTS